jgi:hypothetical protein
MNLSADFHYFSLPVNINHYLCMTFSVNTYHKLSWSSTILIISEWSLQLTAYRKDVFNGPIYDMYFLIAKPVSVIKIKFQGFQ